MNKAFKRKIKIKIMNTNRYKEKLLAYRRVFGLEPYPKDT